MDGKLVEIVELRDHPWMVGSQFHPEFTSRPNRANPLFRDFVGAALERAAQRRDRQHRDEARREQPLGELAETTTNLGT